MTQAQRGNAGIMHHRANRFCRQNQFRKPVKMLGAFANKTERG